MSQSESKINSASELSAEAASFVPSHLKSLLSQSLQQPQGRAEGSSSGSSNNMRPVTPDLPHYVTNCYPFVSTDNTNSAIRNPGVWPQQQQQQKSLSIHVSTSQSGHPHTQLPPPGMFTYTGSRPPGLPRQQLPGTNIRHLRPQHLQQRPPIFRHPLPTPHMNSHQQPGLLPTPPIPPLLPNMAQRTPLMSPVNVPGILPFRMPLPSMQTSPVLQQVGLVGQAGLLNQGPFPGAQGTNLLGNMLGNSLLGAPPGILGAAAATNVGKPGGNKGKNKKKSKEWQLTVSMGTQNEGGKQQQDGMSKKKNRPKTIIYRDATSQTDFWDELADKTLAERPSSLFQKERTRNWPELYQDSTTDSEEVDSDSGYSSPKRNQASSGTHPLTGIQPTQPSGSYIPEIAVPFANVLQQQSYSSVLVQPKDYAQEVAGAYKKAAQSGGGSNTETGLLAGSLTSHTLSGTYSAAVTSQQTNVQEPPQPKTKSARNRKKKRDKQNVTELSGITRTNVSNSGSTAFVVYTDSSANLLTSGSNSVSMVTPSIGGSCSQATVSCDSCQDPLSVLLAQAGQSSNPSEVVRTEEWEEEGAISSGSKRKRKRKRKKKGKSSGDGSPERQGGGTQSDGGVSEVSRTSAANVDSHAVSGDNSLHFEDENEFPDLLSSMGGLSDGRSLATQSLSYSDILKGHQNPASSQESAHSFSSGGGVKSSPDTASVKSSREEKNARRRQKRQQQIDQAASKELAEISLEQQALREFSVKSQQDPEKKKNSGKKTKQPISLSIADMISALEEQQQQKKEEEALTKAAKSSTSSATKLAVSNMLDSSAPLKRGKEREVPKVKKPSPMKKIILKEREEKKRLRLLDEGVDINPESLGVLEPNNNASQEVEFEDEGCEDGEEVEDLVEEMGSQDASSNRSSLEIGTGTTASADLSPISQTSPVSMSPPSGSPSSSGFTSPVAPNFPVGRRLSSSVVTRIHSRRFREYCTQVLDKDIDSCCTVLLQELVRFQDRIYHKDPTKIKVKSKRRIVLGIRECAKHLKLKKLKCVIISPNLERIQSKGGLDDALNAIIEDCQLQSIPFVFALGRRALGRACAKLVPVSVVGVFNYEGCEEHFHKMMELTAKAREAYDEMVDNVENEILDQNPSDMPPPFVPNSSANGSATVTSAIGDVQRFFPNFGHSRTPSACSAISFCSSILSEPISENYPHSEPETDSRGYEIVKDKGEDSSGKDLRRKLERMEQDVREGDFELDDRPLQIVETVNDIDDGHEADTEDNPHGHVQSGKKSHPWADDHDISSKSGKADTSSGMGSSDDQCYEDGVINKDTDVVSNGGGGDNGVDHIMGGTSGEATAETLYSSTTTNSIKDSGQGVESDNFNDFDNDTIEDLPHMDSIHTSYNVTGDYSCSSDILSQQSSRTLDLSVEGGTSTHSSKTIEVENTRNAAGSGSESRISVEQRLSSEATAVSASQKVKTIDKERIESWVMESQKQNEFISVRDEREDKTYSEVEVNGILNEEGEEDEEDEDCQVCDKESHLKEELINDCRSNEQLSSTDNSTTTTTTTALLIHEAKTNKQSRTNTVSEDNVSLVNSDIQNNHCHKENNVNQLDSNKRTLSTFKS